MLRPEINYYALLGLTSTATADEITRAYRKKILEVHLDKRPQGEDSDLCYRTIEAHRVLSDRNLRAKYDILRSSEFKGQERFVPAGAICYDVGQSQLSKRILQSISEWKEEFDTIQGTNSTSGSGKAGSEGSGGGFCNNYFSCFSDLLSQVMADDPTGQEDPDQEDPYYCNLCDKTFLSDTHHWEEVLYPYVNLFSVDKPLEEDSQEEGVEVGVADKDAVKVYAFFSRVLDPKLFEWEPRYLPARPLGIWDSEIWSTLEKVDLLFEEILELLPSEEESIGDQVTFVQETFQRDSGSGGEDGKGSTTFPQSLIQAVVWILEHQEDQEEVVSKVDDLLCLDQGEELVNYGCVMKNLLDCGAEEWTELAKDALSREQPELAMCWTKFAVLFGHTPKSSWFELGMKIHPVDPVLAHFSFLSGGYNSDQDWKDLADAFLSHGDPFASMEYLLNKGNLGPLLEKSEQLANSDPKGSKTLRNVYYSIRVKNLLQSLRDRRAPTPGEEREIEELIELVGELAPSNPLEGYRAVVSSWPDVFEKPCGRWIHRRTVDYFLKSGLTLKSHSLLISAVHFLPPEEQDMEMLATETVSLFQKQINYAINTSDFESLTEILQSLTSRGIPAASRMIQKLIESRSVQEGIKQPFSPHLSSMLHLLQGTVDKVNKNLHEALTEYQNALLSAPECMHRVLPCVSKLSQDIEFHEAIVSSVHTEVEELKELFDCEEYPEMDSYASNRHSLVIAEVSPKVDFGYKNSISKIQPDPEKMANLPPPTEPSDAPPTEANSPMVTLDKHEEAIGEGGKSGTLDELNAALAYVDLLKALPLAFQSGPMVMAGSHFLKAMDSTSDPRELFAFRNAIILMAENLLKIDRKTQATIQHCLTHKHMLSILLSAHEKLAKAMEALENAAGPASPIPVDAEEAENDASLSETETPISEEEEEASEEEENETLKVEMLDAVDVSEIEKQALRNASAVFTIKIAEQEAMARVESVDEEEGDSSPEEVFESFTFKLNQKRPSTAGPAPTPKSDEPKSQTQLIKKSEATLLSKFLKNVINFPKIQPLANIPTLNCSDLVYVETLGNSFLSQFCNEKVRQKYQSKKIPKHLHAYTQLVEVWKGRSLLTDFGTARFKAIKELLSHKGWTVQQVENLLGLPLLNLTESGYASEYKTDLLFPQPSAAFKSIHGFHLDFKTGHLQFLLSKPTTNSVGNLLDAADIFQILSNQIHDVTLSLESPDPSLRSHPFKEIRVQSSTAGSYNSVWKIPNYLGTLARAATLLCYLSSGVEICAKSPFWMRQTEDGLLNRFDEHLQYLLRPIRRRKDEVEGDAFHNKSSDLQEFSNRFWLNIHEVFEEMEEDSSSLLYKVGNVRSTVKVNTFVLTLNGTKAELSPEAEFARDFTRNHNEIGLSFPEFLRIQELAKISLIFRKLREVFIKEKERVAEKPGGNNGFWHKNSSKLLETLKQLGFPEETPKPPPTPGTSTNRNSEGVSWCPATYCNNIDPEVYEVSAGVRMAPEKVTYGPVDLPTNVKRLSVKELKTLASPAVLKKTPLFNFKIKTDHMRSKHTKEQPTNAQNVP